MRGLDLLNVKSKLRSKEFSRRFDNRLIFHRDWFCHNAGCKCSRRAANDAGLCHVLVEFRILLHLADDDTSRPSLLTMVLVSSLLAENFSS